MIAILLAKSENDVIGRDNQLPWHIPEDLRYFKQLTIGKSVVMGRKTFDSIGKALPKRTNYVVTRQTDFKAENVHALHRIDEIPELDGDVFIIGGASLIKDTMHLADRLYLTEIHHHFAGDVFIHLDMSQWRRIESRRGNQDGMSRYSYDFNVYVRV